MVTDARVQLGNAIRAERGKRDFSQEQLGFASGLDRTYVSAVERGRRNVSLEALCKLAQGLETPLSSLLKAAGL